MERLMQDWQKKLYSVKRQIEKEKTVTVKLPPSFAFKRHGATDYDSYLDFFDWSHKDQPVKIDFTECKSANYQALSLLSLYLWRLRAQGCRISTILDDSEQGASLMWRRMGAHALFHVSTDDNVQFQSNEYKPLLGIRNSVDFKKAIATAEEYTEGFDVEYTNTLRYVLSELLYNTLEHGVSCFNWKGVQKRMPSIIQFTWYQTRSEIQFVVGDVGVGIRAHLSQTYHEIESDEDALRLAIRPQVSGTFGRSDPYQAKNNAGVGLYISTNIIRKLNADMHIISGGAVMHVSPRDVTTKALKNNWPGTFVVVSVKVQEGQQFTLHAMMQEFREAARMELSKGDKTERNDSFYFSVNNFFGPYAEDKQDGIKHRDKKLLPAVKEGKILIIDFDSIKSAPHSLLSALLATPIKILGMSAYKRIKIINASPEIRETIDYIMDENTE
jgi:hypothetical protein